MIILIIVYVYIYIYIYINAVLYQMIIAPNKWAD